MQSFAGQTGSWGWSPSGLENEGFLCHTVDRVLTYSDLKLRLGSWLHREGVACHSFWFLVVCRVREVTQQTILTRLLGGAAEDTRNDRGRTLPGVEPAQGINSSGRGVDEFLLVSGPVSAMVWAKVWAQVCVQNKQKRTKGTHEPCPGCFGLCFLAVFWWGRFRPFLTFVICYGESQQAGDGAWIRGLKMQLCVAGCFLWLGVPICEALSSPVPVVAFRTGPCRLSKHSMRSFLGKG